MSHRGRYYFDSNDYERIVKQAKIMHKMNDPLFILQKQTFTEDTGVVVLKAMVSNRSLHRYNYFKPSSTWGKLHLFLCY
jgi:hypothetical protein